MLHSLYAYPDWAIAGLFVAVAVATSIALMLGLRAVLPIRDDKDTFDIAIRVMPAVLSLTAFVLAFSIVQVKNEHVHAEKITIDEATSLAQLDRLLIRIDPQATEPARKAIAVYARSIVADEWPHMEVGEGGFGNDRTRDLLRTMSDLLHRLNVSDIKQSTTFNEVMDAADQIEVLRDSRLREAREGIPSLFWMMIGLLTLLMMALGAFIRPTFTGVVMVASQAAAIGLLSAFLFSLDHPFQGESGVTPWMLERVIAGLSVKP